MEDEDGYVGFAAKAVDSSTVRVERLDSEYPDTSLGIHILSRPGQDSRAMLGAASHGISIQHATHLPVSPLVAPTTVNFSLSSPGPFPSFLLFKKNSNKFPKSCNATSLNANVGP